MAVMRTSFLLAPWLFLASPAYASDGPRAVDILPREMLASSGGPSRVSREIPLGLTAGIMGTLRLNKDEHGGNGSMDLWIGLRYPRMVRTTPFVSLGTEIGFRDHVRAKDETLEWEEETERTDAYTELVPEIRGGFVVVEPSLGAAMLVFQLYGLGGYRLRNRYDPAAVRLGLGVSSSLPLTIAGFCNIPLPIPTTAEVIIDFSSGSAEPGLRLGWVF